MTKSEAIGHTTMGSTSFHIVLISDETYVIGLAATLQSLLTSLGTSAASTRKPLWAAVDHSCADAASADNEAAPASSADPAPESALATPKVNILLLDTGLSVVTKARLNSMVSGHNCTTSSSVNLHIMPAAEAAIKAAATASACSASGNSGPLQEEQSGTAASTTPAAAAAEKTSPAGTAAVYQLPGCSSYSSQGCWLKLLVPQLLPYDVKYALYLDCDMLVLQDPCHLLQTADGFFQVCKRSSPNGLGPTLLLKGSRDT